MKSFLTKNCLIILVLILAAFLRFFHLDSIPPSLNWDEASNGYNAYSILKTGKDEYGNFMPLTFKAFGDYNPALSVYTLVPSIAIFGLNEFAVRSPSAFLGTISVLLTFLIVLKLFKNRFIAIISAAFLCIAPWHLQFSRYDHEANFMLFFVLLGYTLFLYFSKKILGLVSSAAAFGLALNSYHGAKIWIPIFVMALVIWNFKKILKFKKRLFLPLLILFIFALPYIFNSSQTLIRAQSVGITKNSNFLQVFVEGYLSHFGPNFLFITGDQIGRNSVGGIGELYIFEIPLIVFGLLHLIQSKAKEQKFLLTWLLLAPIPASFATPTPHALRAITFLPLWSIFSALGVYSILKSKNYFFKKAFLAVLVLIAIYNVSTYFHLYYGHYPKLKALDWQYGYKQVMSYVDKNKDKYSSVAITEFYGKPYIFTLFYTKYEPSKYQLQSNSKTKFGIYEFFGQSWEKNTQGQSLVVRPAWQKNPDKALTTINFPGGDPAFIISETR